MITKLKFWTLAAPWKDMEKGELERHQTQLSYGWSWESTRYILQNGTTSVFAILINNWSSAKFVPSRSVVGRIFNYFGLFCQSHMLRPHEVAAWFSLSGDQGKRKIQNTFKFFYRSRWAIQPFACESFLLHVFFSAGINFGQHNGGKTEKLSILVPSHHFVHWNCGDIQASA